MKKNELMINDWVKLKGNPYKWQWTHHDFTVSDFGDSLEPIELTSEILEKNGWWFDDIDGNWYSTNHAPTLCGRNCESLSMFDGSVIVGSVHKLQHALMLCNMEDMACNFKV